MEKDIKTITVYLAIMLGIEIGNSLGKLILLVF